MSVRTSAKSPATFNRMTTGTYTGDGAATQAIAGVGFTPRFVIIYRQDVVNKTPGWKIDQDGVFCGLLNTDTWIYADDMIISLDVDGFTVGDGTGYGLNAFNVVTIVYTYICFG